MGDSLKNLMEKISAQEYDTIITTMMDGFFGSSHLDFGVDGFLGIMFTMATMGQLMYMIWKFTYQGGNIFQDMIDTFMIWMPVIFLTVGFWSPRSFVPIGSSLGDYDYNGKKTLLRDGHNFIRKVSTLAGQEAFGEGAKTAALNVTSQKRKALKELITMSHALCEEKANKGESVTCYKDYLCTNVSNTQLPTCLEKTRNAFNELKKQECSSGITGIGCRLDSIQKDIEGAFSMKNVLKITFAIADAILFGMYLLVQVGISIIIIFSLFMTTIVSPLAMYQGARSGIKDSMIYVLALGIIPFLQRTFNFISYLLLSSIDTSITLGYGEILATTGDPNIQYIALGYQGIKAFLYGLVSIGIQIVILSKLPSFALSIFKLQVSAVANAGEAFLDGAKMVAGVVAGAATGGLALALTGSNKFSVATQNWSDRLRASQGLGRAPGLGSGGNSGGGGSGNRSSFVDSIPSPPPSGGPGSMGNNFANNRTPFDVNIEEDNSVGRRGNPDVDEFLSNINGEDLKDNSNPSSSLSDTTEASSVAGAGLGALKGLGSMNGNKSNFSKGGDSLISGGKDSAVDDEPEALKDIDLSSYINEGAVNRSLMKRTGKKLKDAAKKADPRNLAKLKEYSKEDWKNLGTSAAIKGLGALSGIGRLAGYAAEHGQNAVTTGMGGMTSLMGTDATQVTKGLKDNIKSGAVKEFQLTKDEFKKERDILNPVVSNGLDNSIQNLDDYSFLSEEDLAEKLQDFTKQESLVRIKMDEAKKSDDTDAFFENKKSLQDIKIAKSNFEKRNEIKLKQGNLLVDRLNQSLDDNDISRDDENIYFELLTNPDFSPSLSKKINSNTSFKGSSLERVLEKVRNDEKSIITKLNKEKSERGGVSQKLLNKINKLDRENLINKAYVLKNLENS